MAVEGKIHIPGEASYNTPLHGHPDSSLEALSFQRSGRGQWVCQPC